MNRFQIYDLADRMSGDRDLAVLHTLKTLGYPSVSDAILALPRGPSLDMPIPSKPGMINAAERAIQQYGARVFKNDVNSAQSVEWHTRHLAAVVESFDILNSLAIRRTMPTDQEIERLRDGIDKVTHVTSSEVTKYILPLFEKRAVRDLLDFPKGAKKYSDDEIGGLMAAKALENMSFYLKIRVPERNSFAQVSNERGILDMSEVLLEVKASRWGAFAEIREDYIYSHVGPNMAEFFNELQIFSEQGDIDRLKAAKKKIFFSPVAEITDDWRPRDTEYAFEMSLINDSMPIIEKMSLAHDYYETIIEEFDRFLEARHEVSQSGPSM